MANNTTREVTGWVGWVYFAGILMIIAGIFQMINGLTALLHEGFFVVGKQGLLVFDFTTWGWIHLLLGLVVLLAGVSVLSGHLWARVVAVFLAILSILANFAFLEAYPVWSIVTIVVDGFVIYALTVHGQEVRAD